MKEWKTYKLYEVANLTTGFPFAGDKYAKEGIRVVRGDNVTIGALRWDSEKLKCWNEPFDRFNEFSLKEGDIVIGMDGSRVGQNRAQVKNEDLPLLLAQRVACIRNNEKSIQDFLYYLIFNNRFVDYVKQVQTGTSIPHISLKQIGNYEVNLPSLETQTKISQILRALDNKIEINKRINDNLEQQAQVLFNYYFVDNINELGEYSEGSLTDIACYLNGLAMQRFRPNGTDSGLPVLKIKELGQGFCDSSSDRCSSYIKDDYVIENGDIIFSWSGTLLVDLWCGGKCGLNQHLFKVTSNDYPKWYIYFWTKHHLDQFIRIAKDKAVTMGHIKRTELDNANVLIPSTEKIGQIGTIIAPMIDKLINNRVEMMELSSLRDSLLPKLMSGELKINEVDC